MELNDLLQHDLLWFCENSEDSNNSFNLVKLLSNALNEYESQSGFGSASETPNPAPTTSSTPKQQIRCTKKMFKQQGAREFQRRLSRTHATVSECGMNGGATGERLVVTRFQL